MTSSSPRTRPGSEQVYLPRKVDSEVFGALRLGQSCLVVAPPQSGKTRLLASLKNRLHQDGLAVCTPASLIALHDERTWKQDLLELLSVELGFKVKAGEGSLHSRLVEIFNLALRRGSPQRASIRVMLIDEVNSVPRAFRDEFFSALDRVARPEVRPCWAFCLASNRMDEELFETFRPLKFQVFELHDFERVQLDPMARMLCSDRKLGKALLDRVYEWTGGHPFFSQRFCTEIISRSLDDRALKKHRAAVEGWFVALCSLLVGEGDKRHALLRHCEARFDAYPPDSIVLDALAILEKLSEGADLGSAVRIRYDHRNEAHRRLWRCGLVAVEYRDNVEFLRRRGELFRRAFLRNEWIQRRVERVKTPRSAEVFEWNIRGRGELPPAAVTSYKTQRR